MALSKEDKTTLHKAFMEHIGDLDIPNYHYAYKHIIEIADNRMAVPLIGEPKPKVGLLDSEDITTFSDAFTAYKELMGGLDNGFMRHRVQQRQEELPRFVEWMSSVMKETFPNYASDIDASAKEVFPEAVNTKCSDVNVGGQNPQTRGGHAKGDGK